MILVRRPQANAANESGARDQAGDRYGLFTDAPRKAPAGFCLSRSETISCAVHHSTNAIKKLQSIFKRNQGTNSIFLNYAGEQIPLEPATELQP